VTELGAALVLINAVLILALPRAWAALPLLTTAAFITQAQQINLGMFTFTPIRLVILAGLLRPWLRGERLEGGHHRMDRLMLAWAIWALVSSVFHEDPEATVINRLGLAYNALGIYGLVRLLCRSPEDIRQFCRLTALLLVPVALEMLGEHLIGLNLFSVLGGVSEHPAIREGRLRAQGPFAHAILAGTVGATSLPLAAALWRSDRRAALAGMGAGATMVVTSASSGPVISAAAGLFALGLWPYRGRMRVLLWIGVVGYVALDLVMQAPAYYLMGRIGMVGGSSGWHRARLIEAGLAHLPEWWLAGTDNTRHWMPTGVTWSPDHTDITNYYLALGVRGGLPLMLLFVALLAVGFARVGKVVQSADSRAPDSAALAWALGASLFAHAVTGLGISYFDQSAVFLYAALGAIGSLPIAPSPVAIRARTAAAFFPEAHAQRNRLPNL
jgi:hypothetical protein